MTSSRSAEPSPSAQRLQSELGFLTAWLERSGDQRWQLFTRAVGLDGTVLGERELLTEPSMTSRRPSIAFAHDTHAVAFHDDYKGQGHVQLITESGQRGASVLLTAADGGRLADPHVAGDGEAFAVVALRESSGELYFTRLERDGGTSPPAPVAQRAARGG